MLSGRRSQEPGPLVPTESLITEASYRRLLSHIRQTCPHPSNVVRRCTPPGSGQRLLVIATSFRTFNVGGKRIGDFEADLASGAGGVQRRATIWNLTWRSRHPECNRSQHPSSRPSRPFVP